MLFVDEKATYGIGAMCRLMHNEYRAVRAKEVGEGDRLD